MQFAKHKMLIAAIITGALLVSPGMNAQGKTKGQSKKGKAATVAPSAEEEEFLAMVEDLKSQDPEIVIFSVQMLGLSGRQEAVQPLVTLLQSGPRNDITNMAIATLGALGQAEAINTLLPYLNHRRPDARLAALVALEGFDTPEITEAFEMKLRDSDAQVRTSAALALGTRGSQKTVSLLFQAFDLSVNEAAISIGQLANDSDGLRLIDYVGKINIRILLPGFKELLVRKEIKTQTKLRILNYLYELAGPEVRKFSIALRAQMDPERKLAEEPVIKQLDQMIQEISGD